MSTVGTLLDFFFPPKCAACEKIIADTREGCLCDRCFSLLEPLQQPWCERCGIPIAGFVVAPVTCGRCRTKPPFFEKARALIRYYPSSEVIEDPLAVVLRKHKYGLNQGLVRALRRCLELPFPLDVSDYDLVVPVPLHPRRLRWRGFNQAALIARELARMFRLPLDLTSLARIKFITPQTARSHVEREENVRGAFAVVKPNRLVGRRILLVDDVMTTGATANECARVLLLAGASRVGVFTLARAL